MKPALPPWAEEMRDLFKSGSVAQFLLHGNVFDFVPAETAAGPRLLSLKSFLDEVMFETYDVVLHYDRGRGIRAVRGGEDWGDWLNQAVGELLLPASQTREPGVAMELIDRYLLRTLNLRALQGREAALRRIAVIIDFAEFVVPRGDAIQLGGAFSANVVKVLGWANDPAVLQANVVTVLLSEGLHDLSELVVDNPHAATLHIPLPGEAEMHHYIQTLAAATFPELPSMSEVPLDVLSRRLTGLSRVGARTVLGTSLRNNRRLTSALLSEMKKDRIERECQGLMEFVESPYTLDHVAGLDPVKAWLREDAQLIRRGLLHTLPMGYLIVGRIGTGKTFLVQCWAGELGIPCVVFKNFRDRWVGATESNLEKILAVLRALGQVVVFVDEADQAAGRREGSDGDSGLSGRIYATLAKEMSDTRNRGRILWVFATSRPDLLEVDLKRQGRLDVHIPLFPPESPEEMRALMFAIARKLKFPLAEADVPDFGPELRLGGNEIEGVLVRALRIHELSGEPRKPLRDVLADVLLEVRPSAHTRKLEYMDMVAVRECTDARFLPERFRSLAPEDIERRIEELRRFL
ncbi:MAG: ATP-binding protein [Acidobacteria bacterium]|nr:ATP-binding protein [Acidobacteriota bacterium]